MSVKTCGVSEARERETETRIGDREVEQCTVGGMWWSLRSGGRRGRGKGKDDPGVLLERERAGKWWWIGGCGCGCDVWVERETREGSEVFGSRGGLGKRFQRETRRNQQRRCNSGQLNYVADRFCDSTLENLWEMCSSSSWRTGFRRAWLGRTRQEDRWRQGREKERYGPVR